MNHLEIFSFFFSSVFFPFLELLGIALVLSRWVVKIIQIVFSFFFSSVTFFLRKPFINFFVLLFRVCFIFCFPPPSSHAKKTIFLFFYFSLFSSFFFFTAHSSPSFRIFSLTPFFLPAAAASAHFLRFHNVSGVVNFKILRFESHCRWPVAQ